MASMEKAKEVAKKGGAMAGKGVAVVTKKMDDMKIVEKAKGAKNAMYDKMGLSEENKKDADNLGKAVGVLGAAAMAMGAAASMAPALIVGGAAAAGGYVIAKEKAPEHLEKAKEKASKAVEAASEVSNEFVEAAKEAKKEAAPPS